jgi:glycosyltransferase involved in cell wall biosynthesis
MKPTLIIDLRPIQSGKINGVTTSAKNWIKDIIIQTENHANIVFWTTGLSKPTIPKDWLNHKHTKHQHSKIPNKILNLILSQTGFLKIDKLLKIKAHSYFCPDLRPFKVSKNCKSYIYIHDIAFIKFKRFYSNKSKLWYKLIKPKNIYQKANHILTNSKFSKSELIKQFGHKNITVVHPYLDSNFKKENSKKPINKSYFIAVSTLQPRKNLNRLISSFNQFNQQGKHHLIVIGSTENTFKKVRQPKNRNIHFLGYVKESMKKKFIQHAVGLIHIPLYEGFSLPILESLTLGTPVLASNIPPHHEIYTEQINYCVSSNCDQISAQIPKLLEQKSVEFEKLVDRTKLPNLLLA